MKVSETEILIRSAQRGEQQAYRRLFEAYSPGVYASVCRLTGHTAVAEEITQDVFLRAFTALSTFDSRRASFYTWLQRLAYNASVSYLRLKPPPEPITLSDDTAEPKAFTEAALQEAFASDDDNLIEKLTRAIEQLPAPDKHLLTLYYYENLTLKEIGYILGVSIPTLSIRLKKIRQKLYLFLTASSL